MPPHCSCISSDVKVVRGYFDERALANINSRFYFQLAGYIYNALASHQQHQMSKLKETISMKKVKIDTDSQCLREKCSSLANNDRTFDFQIFGYLHTALPSQEQHPMSML